LNRVIAPAAMTRPQKIRLFSERHIASYFVHAAPLLEPLWSLQWPFG
jgi:hypothetical protein